MICKPDNFTPCKRFDLARVEAQLLQHLRRLRAEPLRRQAHAGLFAVIQHGVVEERHGCAAFAGARHRDEGLHVLHLGVGRNLGVALEQQGRLADARAQYEAAAKLDPNRVQAQVNLANVLDASGETEKAIEHYRMALQLDRNSPLVHLNYGSALVKLGRFDEAKQHYDEAKRLAPNDPRAFYLMGKSLLRQGRSQEAVVEFKDALRIDPNHLQTLVWFARTRAVDFDPQVRQGSDAVKLAKQAVEMTGEGDPFILDTLAAALAESGRFVEAEQTLQRALQLLSDAGDTNTTALTTRLQLYRLKQPYRESFTNAAEGNVGQR